MSKRLFHLHVNGAACEVEAFESASLLDVLRGPLGLTGTKSNCQEAECGVCTVLLDGRAVTSCLVLAAQCEDREVVTIEGLAEAGEPAVRGAREALAAEFAKFEEGGSVRMAAAVHIVTGERPATASR